MLGSDKLKHLSERNYTHLTTNELVMIEAYYKESLKVTDIVKALGRSKQTTYNVLNYLKEEHFVYDYYKRYKVNKKGCVRNKTSLTQAEKDFIQTHLDLSWSLDVIKGVYPDRISCSMRTLYQLADRGIFKKENLPWKGKRKPNGHREKRGKQAFRRDLRERAVIFPNFKTEFGHLEGDAIVGEKHKSAVITLVERLSKAIITLKTEGRKASDIEASINQWLSQVPSHLFKSITFDCGKEFSNWKSISNAHDIDIFFADPGCPGQRGLNEHSNGLLRRNGLPKQMDFTTISQKYLSAIADKRNRMLENH